jgi:indolepyruvate ferredoxin oxidoreductase beta subunit
MPNLNTPHNRPITLALLAMGGEGGGVLADWAIDMAEHNGFFAQTTSVPGVAQRTGTTVYYLEFFPDDGAGKPGVHEPVLSTMATPGEVDIVVASELMEAGRAIFRGFVTSDITTFITSTHRVYSMTERTSMGDGRVDSEEIMKSAKAAAKKVSSSELAKIYRRLDKHDKAINTLVKTMATESEVNTLRKQIRAIMKQRSGSKKPITISL